MILEDLLVLLDADESKYPLLTILKNRAITLVKNYLNSSVYDSVYIEDNFSDAIIELVCNAYMDKGKSNVQAESQGSRSITYKSGTVAINDDVKKLLPTPYVRMIG